MSLRIGFVLAVAAGLAGVIRSPTAALGQNKNSAEYKELMAAYERGDDLNAQGRYAQAAIEYEKTVALAPGVFGGDSTDTAAMLNNLAELYLSMGHYAKAEPLYARALEIWKKAVGTEHPNYATSLNNLGMLYACMCQYAKAEQLLLESLEIRRRAEGEKHLDTAMSLTNLAELYRSMGYYAKAEPLYLRSLEIKKNTVGEHHPSYAVSQNGLALLYTSTGQFVKAEWLLVRAIEIRKEAPGAGHPDYAASLNALAELYKAMGQYDKAEPLYVKAMEIFGIALGKEHRVYATNLSDLASLYRSMGRFEEAEPLYFQALEIRKKVVGKEDPDYASSLNSLAMLYSSMGQYVKAEPLYVEALRVDEKAFGKDHPSPATDMNNLALLYSSMGQHARAKALHIKTMEIRKKTLGEDHPDYATSLNNLAWLSGTIGDWTKAIEDQVKGRRIIRRHLARILPALAETEQLVLLQTQDSGPFQVAASLGLAAPRGSGAISASAEWLLNGKSLTGEVLAERTRLALDSQDPQAAKVVEGLSSVRAMLARLSMNPPKDGDSATYRARLDELIGQERAFSKQLGQLTRQGYREDPWVSLDEVRKTVGTNAILIEIARFDVFNFKVNGQENRWQPARYAAWIIPPAGRGDVTLVDVGEAEPIDNAINELRRVMQSAREAAQADPVAAEKPIRERLAAVAQRILAPLEPHIGPSEHWLISPDGALWLVPWGALPTQDGAYAIECHRISYLMSGRDLVAGGYKATPKRSLVMADPDYDLGVQEAIAEAKRLSAGEQLALATERGGATRSGDIGAARWSRLEGTAQEAQAIVPKLKAYAKEEPSLYAGKQALESVFKRTHSPKVVLLSTHGFFLDDQVYENMLVPLDMQNRGTFLAPKRKAGEAPAAPARIENPLLRCGLALAGANNRDKASKDADDGVLTGLEIVGTDLRGTDLVVLSACETGVGKVLNGEGVAGLRQAFQLAGAKSVVSTLWRIPDAETTEIMTAFFDNLARGENKSTALRNAQLAMIAKLRKEKGSAHPYYWAAFTLTGEGEKGTGEPGILMQGAVALPGVLDSVLANAGVLATTFFQEKHSYFVDVFTRYGCSSNTASILASAVIIAAILLLLLIVGLANRRMRNVRIRKLRQRVVQLETRLASLDQEKARLSQENQKLKAPLEAWRWSPDEQLLLAALNSDGLPDQERECIHAELQRRGLQPKRIQ